MKRVTKTFGVDFHSRGGALTLEPDYIGHNDSGWTIVGEIQKDYYEWVNEFTATHPRFGKVSGDFESEVVASSEEAFNNFLISHAPTAWDYRDI